MAHVPLSLSDYVFIANISPPPDYHPDIYSPVVTPALWYNYKLGVLHRYSYLYSCWRLISSSGYTWVNLNTRLKSLLEIVGEE